MNSECHKALALLELENSNVRSSSQSSWSRGSALLNSKTNVAVSFCLSGDNHWGFLSSEGKNFSHWVLPPTRELTEPLKHRLKELELFSME